MIKYKLSKYVSINNLENYYDDIPPKYSNDHFIMYDEKYDNEYLINATVKYYIDKFSIPETEKEVLKEIKRDVHSNSKEIGETCSRFFEFLCKTKILVPANKTEDVITNEPLYEEDDIIDNLRILSLLSGRQYTDVYTAIDTTNDRVYVIKVLNRTKTLSTERFQKGLSEMEVEYKMLQKASLIPSINKAYGFKKIEGLEAYLVLEYINGKSLSRYMKEEAGSLTHSCCMQIIAAIINAFSCLHESGIIHGDIHSSNILVTNEMDLRVIDLGLSRDVNIEKNEVTRSGGVYYYMPPERINITTFKKFSKEPDLYSDVYQVGILIYFILYNSLPFEGFIWEELAQNIKENNVTCSDLSFLNYPVPSQLIDIIKKCLDKEFSNRYRSASEILAEFKEHAFAKKQLMEI